MTGPATAVFLTGGTGCLGTQIAEGLAARGTRVLLLVRPKTKRSAEAWLSNLRKRDGQAPSIVLLEGDITHPRVLTTPTAADRVRAEASVVIHAAAVTNLAADVRSAWTTNVDGTRNLLEFARTMPTLRRFMHLSAAAVGGDVEGRFGEAELDRGQCFYNAYAESKHVAEGHVRAAMAELPITIARPSAIVGHSLTGAIDRIDGVYYLILLLLRLARLPRPLRVLPVAPGGDVAHIDLVPIDFVVQALLALAEHSGAEGATVHLSDPRALTVRQLARVFAAELGIRGPVFGIRGRPLAMVLRGGRSSPTLRTLMDQLFNLPPELADGLAHRAVYDSTDARRLLDPLGIVAPHVGDYVAPLLDFARRRLL